MTTTDTAKSAALRAADFDDEQARALVVEALHAGAPTVVVQPILELATGRTVTYEALSRFTHGGPALTPDQWFALAHRIGLGPLLEARAVDLALKFGADRPRGVWLSVNVSPSVLSSPELDHVLPHDLSGIQFEITETEFVEDRDHLGRMLAQLRGRGARVAVDDVGEGYAGLQRVMEMAPDVLKLDRSLITGVEQLPGKAALVEAVVRYAAKVGATVCAEGVESLEGLSVLADLDVGEAQGWVVGLPAPAFEESTRAARLTCESSFARALSVTGEERSQPATLDHAIGRLVAVDDLDELARLMSVVADVVDCDRVQLSLVDDLGQFVEAVSRDEWRLGGVRFDLSEYPTTHLALERREMVQVLASMPEADPSEVTWLAGDGFRSLLLVPVVSAGRAIGLIECCTVEERPWSRRQIRTIRTLATVIGPVIDSLRVRTRG